MVLAVVTILSIVAYPSIMSTAQRIEYKAEVSALVGWLHKAKAEAANANCFVVIEATPNGYMIFLDNSSIPEQAENWSRQPDERQLVDYRLKNGVTLANNFPSNKARFSGRPGGMAGRFIFTDRQGSRMDVIISAAGRIRVESF